MRDPTYSGIISPVRRAWLPLLGAVLQLVTVSTGSGARPAPAGDELGLGLVVLSAAALILRHRRPLPVLGFAAAAYVGQVLLAGPAPPAVPAIAAATVARALLLPPVATRAPVLILGATVAACPLVVGAAGEVGLAAPVALFLVLAVLAGLAGAVRAARSAALRREAMSAERLRIARDLHDVVGHGVGAITVQAGAGRLALAAGAGQDADRALRTIEEAGRAVLRDVRWMVGLLRDDAERPGLRDVATLVRSARRSGLSVRLDEQGELAAASGGAGEAAYRVVQEALTNVVRHSDGQDVRVQVGVRGGEVVIEVRNDGSPVADVEPGHGLTGMQERVAALGGQLHTGPDPGGGWTVSAALPLHGRAR